MSRDIHSPRHEAVRKFLKRKRQPPRCPRQNWPKRLDRPPAYVSAVETGQQRVTVVEFLDFADALGFDPRSAFPRSGPGWLRCPPYATQRSFLGGMEPGESGLSA